MIYTEILNGYRQNFIKNSFVTTRTSIIIVLNKINVYVTGKLFFSLNLEYIFRDIFIFISRYYENIRNSIKKLLLQ